MFTPDWQKSSFSGGPEGNCVYIASAPDGTIHLRESDEPEVVLRTSPDRLAALIGGLKQAARWSNSA
ncbi:DUF397 domain-containing protein [Streptomyces sp. ISL-99]|uniref:DUF397 domain-containing protein n=1 Tax=Streptomyces sp. ISL-99 TaxID=2819193 RepID=UPI001BEB2DB6|nr:DUF397 domain-containing protein [Streptomyces sp. ISL-99]MBT2529308.1 DUF397 domain-containing protein [Streptomyces sp. ISL-99]